MLAGLVSFGLVFANNHQAYAHTFSGDESASFLALAESIRTELQLVQSNLASNASVAEEHTLIMLASTLIMTLLERLPSEMKGWEGTCRRPLKTCNSLWRTAQQQSR